MITPLLSESQFVFLVPDKTVQHTDSVNLSNGIYSTFPKLGFQLSPKDVRRRLSRATHCHDLPVQLRVSLNDSSYWTWPLWKWSRSGILSPTRFPLTSRRLCRKVSSLSVKPGINKLLLPNRNWAWVTSSCDVSVRRLHFSATFFWLFKQWNMWCRNY